MKVSFGHTRNMDYIRDDQNSLLNCRLCDIFILNRFLEIDLCSSLTDLCVFLPVHGGYDVINYYYRLEEAVNIGVPRTYWGRDL